MEKKNLFQYIAENDWTNVNHLLSTKGLKKQYNEYGFSPINWAIKWNAMECMHLLLQHGGNINEPNTDVEGIGEKHTQFGAG